MTEESVNYWRNVEAEAQAGTQKIRERQDRQNKRFFEILQELRQKFTQESGIQKPDTPKDFVQIERELEIEKILRPIALAKLKQEEEHQNERK